MLGEPRKTRFSGAAGTAEWMPYPHTGKDWREETTIDIWLVDAPGQSPLWRYYVLTGCHLRDVDGQRPPRRQSKDSSHEILVLALNPDHHCAKPDAQAFRAGPISFLAPPNIAMQIANATDAQCRELLMLLAEGMANGSLPSEPPFQNATGEPTWRRTINAHLARIQTDGGQT